MTGTTRIGRVLAGTLLLAFALLLPGAAWAWSPGCTAINSGSLDYYSVFSGAGNLSASGARFFTSVSDQAINSLRAVAGTTDPAAGTAAYDGNTYTFAAGDVVTLSATVTGFSGTTSILAAIRRGTSATAVTEAGGILTFTGNGSQTISYSITGAETSIGLRVSKSDTPNGMIAISATCIGAAPAPAPTVTAVSPTSGGASAATSVTITGTNFTGATAVMFGATPVTSFTVRSPTQISTVAPNGPTGTVDVTVTTPSGTSPTGGADQYTYIPGPTVTAISPTSGPGTGGTSVTISGTDFTSATAVLFGSTPATSFTVDSATQITAVAPAGTGTVDVHVATDAGFSPTSAADQYTYVAAPTITPFPPNLPNPQVGVAYSQTLSATGGTGPYTFAVTAGAPPTGLTLTNGTLSGTPTAGGPFNFTITATDSSTGAGAPYSGSRNYSVTVAPPAPPSVGAVSPNQGPATGGTVVTITGVNFTGAAAVSFGSTPATSFTVDSATQITAVAPAGAGTVDVRVTTSGGFSPISVADKYTYVGAAAPVVTTNPSNQTVLAGATATFTAAASGSPTPTVQWQLSTNGGTTFRDVAGAGGTSPTLTFPTAASADGWKFRAVFTNSGGSATTSAATLTVNSPPTVTSVSPTAGATSGGTSVVITGTDFTGATAVQFGTTSVTSFTVISPTQISTVAPNGSPETVDVTVTTPFGTSATNPEDQYTYIPGPTVTAISPTSGPVAGGTSVTISGTDLTGATVVNFGASAAASFTVNSDTQITAVAPAGAGTVDVRVFTDGGFSPTSAADQYTYVAAAAPVVTTNPSNQTVSAGASATFTAAASGSPTPTVQWQVSSDSGATFTDIPSATSTSYTKPATTAADNGKIYRAVFTNSPGSATSNNALLTVNSAPVVTTQPTDQTIVSGQNTTFAAAATGNPTPTVQWQLSTNGGTTFSNIAGGTNLTLSFATTASQNGWKFRAVFTNSVGSATTNSATLTVNSPPTVTSVSPAVGDRSGGTSVVIRGTNFTGATAVSFGGTPASSYTVNSTTQITAISPAHAAGTVNVRVTTSGGTSATAAANQFTYLGPPMVTAVSPSSGGASAATGVTITGANFTGATAVMFGATSVTSFTVISPTQISTVAPNGPTGTVDVTVTTPSGTSATSGADQYTYIPGPTVTAISPISGPGAGGTSVTISGTDFTGATAVLFGSTPAASFTVDSDTQITAVAPAGTGMVDVHVATDGGFSPTSAADQFTYVAAPVANPQSVAVPYNTATAITVTATNSPTSYAVSTPPQHGTLTGTGPTFTYTPTAGYRGPDSFQFTATNAGGTSAPATVTITVGNPTLSSTLTNGTGTRGTPLSGTAVTTTGGAAPYSCTLASGALPGGTTLNSDCTITGTPAASGTFNFTVAVTDSSTGTGPFTQTSGTLTLTIAAPTLTQSPAAGALPATQVGAAYSQAFTANGGTSPYSYMSAGSPPPGLTLTGDTLSGTPTTTGDFSFSITATDSSSAGSGGPYSVTNAYTLHVGDAAPVAGPVSATVAYGSSNNSVTLALSGGPTTSVSVASPATNGTATASGTAIAYTPAAGYYGTDSFTYTATGPGGTSAPATVTITVGTPPAPTAADRSGVGVAYNSSGTAIDLSSSITGVHSGIAIGTGPAHGTVSVAGDVATYTPAAGYYGSDSFTYTATGPGGTSTPATVTLTVATPSAPVVADRNGIAVPYNGSGTAIDLSSSITGDHSSVAVATAPAHGTVSVSGDVVTYTPASGYYGPDSFTYTATGPGGTSAPATVTLTVATPAAPVVADRNGVAIPYNSSGSAIDLSSSITGVHGSIAVATAPAHGTVGVSGDVVTYTPASGYYGPDSFTYTASGPGGTSAPATVTLTVATPAAPVVADRNGVAVPYNGSGTAIDLSSAITGVHGSVAVATAPAHGTVGVSGDVVTYTPASGYYGPDSFTYAATGPGGTSAPATVTLTVATPSAPIAADAGANVSYNSSGTVIDLASSISGVHSSIALATAPAHGTVSVSGDVVTYTPTAGYYGPDGFAYTATGPGGTSAPATVRVTVGTPPAPTAGDRSVAVPYNSSGTAIELSSSITGVYSSIAAATAPAHGTVSMAGDVATYAPAGGYYGSDSFTYSATGPGGTSAPATVTLTVATPAAPVVSDRSGIAVPYNSSGTAIDLASSISGVHSSIALATVPTHGTASVSGDVATYTPAVGYFGADSFTYTATGPGGTSAPATVRVTVGTPPVPTAAPVSANVPYDSAGTAIALQPSGVYTSVAVATAPAHGSVTISGTTAAYTPAAGYFGADSFTYTVTGPGGSSAPATVSITVATPAAPVAAGRSVTLPYQTATPIDLGGSITGLHTGIAVATAPAHGTVSVSGDVVTYTPAAGYFGADSFTYTVSGPGGTSAPATVSITVATPPPPQATSLSPAATVRNGAGASVTVNLRPLITGEATSVAIVSQPAAGSVTIDQGSFTATYTPNAAYAGSDSFTFRAVGPGGSSNVATVGIQVIAAVPTAQPRQVSVLAGRPITIDLTGSAAGGPFTGGALISVSPADAADVRLVEGGTAASRTYTIEFTSQGSFSGPVTILYTLANAGGTSAPLTLTVNVQARPDPSADAEVRGVEQAETGAARQVADTQIRNFGRRLQQLHGDAPSGGFAVSVEPGIPMASANRQPNSGRYGDPTLLDSSDALPGDPRRSGPVLEQYAAYRGASAPVRTDSSGFGATGNGRLDRGSVETGADVDSTPASTADGGGEASAQGGAAAADDGRRRNGSVELWANGSVTVGRRDPVTGVDELSITTSGLTGGADVRVADGATIGIGAGIGRDDSDIGDNGSELRSQSWVVGAYGSFRPAQAAFIDVLVGFGRLDFDLTRYVNATGTFARGDRSGDLLFGSVTAGIDRHARNLTWSLYGGIEASRAGLDDYSETGPLGYSLTYDSRTLEAITGLLGGRFELERPMGGVVLTPRGRFEYRYDFADVEDQRVRFSDFLTGPSYLIDADGWSRHRFSIEVGLGLRLPTGWRFGLDLNGEASGNSRSAGVRATISQGF